MKKGIILSLSFLFSILSANSLSAQMMPDSTVQVIAYWEVGDYADYAISQARYQVGKDEEETLTGSSERKIHIEVVEATDSTYTLAITDPDAFSFGMGFDLRPEDRETLPSLTYRVTTNQYGTLLRLEDGEEVYEKGLQIVPLLAKASYKTLNKQAKALYPSEESYLEDITRNIKNPDYLKSFLVKDIPDLLFFHGSRLDTTKEYSLATDYTLPIGETILMEGACWVDSKWTDEYSVVLHKVLDGSDHMLDALRNYLYRLQADEEEALSYEEFCKEFDKEVFKGSITGRLEDSLVEEVHLDSGWPIQLVSDFYSVVEAPDGVDGAHHARTISLIRDEEETTEEE